MTRPGSWRLGRPSSGPSWSGRPFLDRQPNGNDCGPGRPASGAVRAARRAAGGAIRPFSWSHRRLTNSTPSAPTSASRTTRGPGRLVAPPWPSCRPHRLPAVRLPGAARPRPRRPGRAPGPAGRTPSPSRPDGLAGRLGQVCGVQDEPTAPFGGRPDWVGGPAGFSRRNGQTVRPCRSSFFWVTGRSRLQSQR
jgi:hypothetical protein